MYTHILVPTDGSPLSRRAARAAARLAESTGAKVTSTHVAAPFRPATVDFVMPYELLTSEQHDAWSGKSAAKVLAQAQKPCKDAGVHGRACT